MEDRDLDVAVDARTESFQRLGDGYSIEGFDPQWMPPEYPGDRILEDNDFDGYYEQETITSGDDPNGNPSYWRRR